MDRIVIEIREPGRDPRRVSVTSTVEVGRECNGVLLADDTASRRHVALTPSPEGLTVTDLGSSNGTFINGTRLQEPQVIGADDVVRIGATELAVVDRTPAPPPSPKAPPPLMTVRFADEPASPTLEQPVIPAPAPVAEPVPGPPAPVQVASDEPPPAITPPPWTSSPDPPAPVAPAPPPPPAPAPVAEAKPAASGDPRPEPPSAVDVVAHERMQAGFAWARYEAGGGVEWPAFVQAVIDVGLDDMPAVIARLRDHRQS